MTYILNQPDRIATIGATKLNQTYVERALCVLEMTIGGKAFIAGKGKEMRTAL